MSVSVTLPALGESVTEGTVTRWLKKEGDTVQADEPLLEISTDKVDTEIPAPASGVLLEIKVREDETVDVGTELAVIGDSAERGAPARAEGGGEAATQMPAATLMPAAASAAGSETGAAPLAADAPAPPNAPQAPAATDAAAPAAPAEDASAAPAPAEPAPAAPAPAAPAPAAPAPAASAPAAPAPAAPSAAGVPAASSSGDTVSVTLPALGESVTEGTVTRWLKQEGDAVQADEPLLEISTDKVDTEIPAPASGVLVAIKVREDETVDVGTELAVIGSQAPTGGATAAAQPPTPEPRAEAPPAPPAVEAPSAPGPPSAPAPPPPGRPAPAERDVAPAVQRPFEPDRVAAPAGDGAAAYVTPLVRKLAAEHGVDLAALRGTGVGGRIRKQDVLEAAEAAKRAAAAPPAATPTAPAPTAAAAPAPALRAEPSPLRGRTEKMSRLRQLIATRMVESLRISAQLTTVTEADVTKIARLRDRAKRDFEGREGVKLSFLPFFALATVEALKQHPNVNAVIDSEKNEITYHDAEHLGVAVDTDRGLLVPVIKNAGDLNLAGFARKIADLAARTRNNKITPDELTGGTFTLTNTGSRGVLFDTPIINQPQVAILGTGAVVKRPVVVDDAELGETIAIRSVIYLSLTYDHRLIDGADAARFLGTIKQRLEDGAFEAELQL